MTNPGPFTDLLEGNAVAAAQAATPDQPAQAARRVAVVTCMDARIDPLAMLGLHAGDAVVLRTAGGRVTAEATDSLVLAVHLLDVDRIMIVEHTRCAVASSSEAEVRAALAASVGVPPTELDVTVSVIEDQLAALAQDVAALADNPLIGSRAAIAGFRYDVDTGLLHALV